jgi:nucleoid-associated protein YgaU
MHRDTQIGLALAIVLIGLAAALCFPRSAAPPAHDPAPQAAALDALLQHAPVKLYDEPTAVPVPQAVVDAAASPVSTPTPTPMPTPAGAADASAAASQPAAGEAPSTEAGAALAPPPGIAAPIALAPADDASPADRTAAAAAAPADLFHVVQPGDTLSGIAAKYLGSVARYPELFEANRDVLRSPDALQLGMQLRIPQVRGR